jgi:hypothetical protein
MSFSDFSIDIIISNEKRTEIYLKSHHNTEYFTLNLIKNKIYLTYKNKIGEIKTKEANYSNISKINTSMDYLREVVRKDLNSEIWLLAYFQMLIVMTNGNGLNPKSIYSRTRYEMARRVFGYNDNYRDSSCFEQFSPICEKIAKQGFCFEKDIIHAIKHNTEENPFTKGINLSEIKLNYTDKVNQRSIYEIFKRAGNVDRFIRGKLFLKQNPYIDTIINISKVYIDNLNIVELTNTVVRQKEAYDYLVNVCKYDIKRLIKYLYQDLRWQGIDFIQENGYYNGTLNLLKDYAQMSYVLHKGNSFDKYPKYLKTQHDIVAMTYEIKKNEALEQNYIQVVQQYKKFEEFKDNKYCIIVPKSPNEIVEEGVKQSHCVASYVENVCQGRTLILFLRLKDKPSDSLITIEYNNNSIVQARGYSNRSPVEEENDAIEKFCKKFGIIFEK